MRFLFVISTKNRINILGHEGKDNYRFLAMITAILSKLLKIVSKEDILKCLEAAEEYNSGN